MFQTLPTLLISFLLYNAVVFLLGTPFDAVLFSTTMPSGAEWDFTVSDILIVFTIFLLFVEILKATSTGGSALIDHALSTLLFVACLIEFLVVPEAATSVFFVLTMTTLIDVIAGFSVTIRAARRDFAVGDGTY